MKPHILVDGSPIGIDPADLAAAHEVEPGVYSVLLGGRSYEARLTPSGPGFTVSIRGRQFQTEVIDPRAARSGSKTARAGRQTITAPMPGKVVRILVEEGQSIEAGHGLIVVEAMKMQNQMKAPKPGRVAAIQVRDGDTVAAGDALMVIE